MALTVRQLQQIFESLDKDIDELKKTNSSVPIDREYSPFLKDKIIEEIEKFEGLKKSILELEIEVGEEVEQESPTIISSPEYEYSDPSFYTMF